MFDKTTRVNLLIGTGHFFSHFYILTLPPLFVAWHETFDVSYAALGLSAALMAGTTAMKGPKLGISSNSPAITARLKAPGRPKAVLPIKVIVPTVNMRVICPLK